MGWYYLMTTSAAHHSPDATSCQPPGLATWPLLNAATSHQPLDLTGWLPLPTVNPHQPSLPTAWPPPPTDLRVCPSGWAGPWVQLEQMGLWWENSVLCTAALLPSSIDLHGPLEPSAPPLPGSCRSWLISSRRSTKSSPGALWWTYVALCYTCV